jgi:hypothetical protein
VIGRAQCALCRIVTTILLGKREKFARAGEVRAHNSSRILQEPTVEQGQGESTSPVQNAIGFSSPDNEGRNSIVIERRVKQTKESTIEWPGPLDGPLGYSET